MANRTNTRKFSAKKATTLTIAGERVTLSPAPCGDEWTVNLPDWRGVKLAGMGLTDNGDDWTANYGSRCFTAPTHEAALTLLCEHAAFIALRK